METFLFAYMKCKYCRIFSEISDHTYDLPEIWAETSLRWDMPWGTHQKSFEIGAVYKPRGQNSGQFWLPFPLCRHFYLIAVIKCCVHLSNSLPPHLSTWFVHAPRVIFLCKYPIRILHQYLKVLPWGQRSLISIWYNKTFILWKFVKMATTFKKS